MSDADEVGILQMEPRGPQIACRAGRGPAPVHRVVSLQHRFPRPSRSLLNPITHFPGTGMIDHHQEPRQPIDRRGIQ